MESLHHQERLPHPVELDQLDLKFLDEHRGIVRWYVNLDALMNDDHQNERVWRPLSKLEWYFLMQAKEQAARIRRLTGFNADTEFVPSLIESIWDFATRWHQEWDEGFLNQQMMNTSMGIHRVVKLLDALDRL